jgi:transposase-like protein
LMRLSYVYVYVWSAVDVDSRELLALEASYGRSSINALTFLKKALCVLTSRWYWLIEAHGIDKHLRGLG